MRSSVRPTAFAFAVVLALGACGSTSERPLSAAQRAKLSPLVQQVRRAAESRDIAGARRALAELRHAVASYENNGDVSRAKAAQILDAATQVQHRLALVPTSTTTTTTTPTTTTEPTRGRGHGKKDKQDNGNGD